MRNIKFISDQERIMKKILFTSDLHIGHKNAIKLDNRPFETVEKMDAELIRRWNNKVIADDTVYILGDFLWATREKDAVSIINKLNGRKILIKGNHETVLRNKKACEYFDDIKDYAEIVVKLSDGTKQRCVLSHYFMPFYNGSRHGSIMLYGHTHNSKENVLEEEIKRKIRDNGIPCNAFNVGCMHWNYEPVTLSEILNSESSRYDFPH